ncbi:GNAT family N-acetyltransferase [Mycobacterium sp. PS03-16]|uniref:GNAT family N-acetyltransferase n=1 Tax=Mycobacterium sp. PS03-16 TaxID=2559611 RepID=UPI0010736846|nr:GNAT family N-acetyltransferase [Mycobacterium sp. PS03-16]TFV57392.1 GNAT family N-acetyltransferase [Mycobacterium sp. PS03-16]
MRLRTHPDVGEFISSAAGWYRRRPVVHTVELTLLREGVPGDDQPLLLTVWEGDDLIGAAMQTPPLPMLCGGLSVAPLPEVAGAIATESTIPGVRGPREVAEPFARAWRDATGAAVTTGDTERLYRLATLTPPAGVPGGPRLAGPADTPVLVHYRCEFAAEAFGHVPDRRRAEDSLAVADRAGNVHLLWTAHGAPVSMAGVRAPAAGVSRIGPVYTPPEVRGRGYGAAVTAAACRWALAAGAEQVVLFADLANPTSNGVYQRLGFVPVGDSVSIDFRVP